MESPIMHTPGPWEWKDVAGAGLEIFAPVHLVEAVHLPKGMPAAPINIYGLASPQNYLIAYERWVQFEPKGWNEMQTANAQLIAAVPDLLTACKAFVEAWERSLQLEKTDVALRLAKAAIDKALLKENK